MHVRIGSGVRKLPTGRAGCHGDAQAYPDGTAVLPPGRLAWNPTEALDVPGARVPLKPTFFIVTTWPLVVRTVFHEPVITWPAGRVKVTVQLVMVELPVLVIVSGWIT